jgi:hypothetical protein
MPQYARPDADEAGNSFVNELASNSNMFDSINESTPSDTDYIVSAKNPANNVYVCHLTSVDDPLVDTGHIINFRYKKDVAVNAEQIDLTVQLRQDYVSESNTGTLIAQTYITNISSSWTNGSYTLSNT